MKPPERLLWALAVIMLTGVAVSTLWASIRAHW